MSSYVRPSVPLINGRSTPWSMPVLAPFAPGNVPKRLSNVRFSLIRKMTCLIGHRVGKAEASTASGLGPPPVRAGGEADVLADADGEAGPPAPEFVHAAATRAAINRVRRARRMEGRSLARPALGAHAEA